VSSVAQTIAPLIEKSKASAHLKYSAVADLPHFVFKGPLGGDEPIRIGIFAAIHGDEHATATGLGKLLEFLTLSPQLARDFALYTYPICNPSGFENCARCSRSGKDLNREFWKNSTEPEVIALEKELREHRFDGIISLHSDDTVDGLYGFVSGATLSQSLLEPALAAAELFLPRNRQPLIDGFPASEGIIVQGYQGILCAPPEVSPRPFELILETPQLAPIPLQEQAFVVALLSILAEYRKTMSYAANL
jgi:murein peptide amidase A